MIAELNGFVHILLLYASDGIHPRGERLVNRREKPSGTASR